MKKYFVIYGICGIAFVLSLAALVLNRHLRIPMTVFGGSENVALRPTLAGDIALIVLGIFALVVIIGLIIYGIYRLVHRNK
ncbi:MAG: hypothetical protein J1F01_01645 [Oscillospiraceae bacterium]|nr:hypothetical protein [Oscillospiraceae bacterium]